MTVTRRRRNTMREPAPVGWLVERAAKDRFAQLAKDAGMSAALLLEHVTAHLVVGDDKKLSWSDTPTTAEAPTDSP